MKKVILYSTAVRKKRGGFSPPDRANLVGWWDASAITGLSDNDPVSSWADKSGLGHTLTQSTADLRPTYKTGRANSRPGVYGSADRLDCNAVAAYFTGDDKPVTAIAAMSCESLPGFAFSVAIEGATPVPIMFPISASSTTFGSYFCRSDAGADKQPGYTFSPASLAPFILCHHSTGKVFNAWINNEKKKDAFDVDTGTATLTKFSVFGAQENGTTFAGDYYELFLYKSALSDANRQAIQTYLAAKWGITLV